MTTDVWRSANQWRVLDHPEYTFDVEELRSDDKQMIFVHLEVREPTKVVLKKMLHEFQIFRDVVDVPLYASSPNSNKTWQRFVSLFGFKHLIDGPDGRKIFVSIKG